MKTNSLRIVVSLIGVISPVAAQDLGGPGASESSMILFPQQLPAVERVRSSIQDGPSVVMEQELGTLEDGMRVVSVPVSGNAADVLGASPAFGSLTDGGSSDAKHLEQASAAYREPGTVEKDCQRLGLSVEERVKREPSELLEAVESEIRVNPGCACEVVKSAIRATDGETETVVAITETAMLTAPEHVRLISQCAIAAAPDSLSAIQALLARYDANAGEEGESAKSAKSSKDSKSIIEPEAESVAAVSNPLDFPGNGPVGPQSGMPGGEPLVPVTPPIVAPPVTAVDP
ncbi:MAG: hypothetical protein H7A49_00165 [Akkermansiaceae bacterium]|nr:hypothetical protein [Akkermansiaceae bacterium]MCP5542296.1 hypothetical protein [Akkermansiaceae bacterium]MCP5546167.1 hypothetical protein [Akkermansiaceae bacterium]